MPANGQNPSKIPQSLWQSRSLEWGRKSYPSLTAVLLLLLLLLLLLQAGTYVVLSLPNLLRVGPVSASFHPCWDDFRKLPPVATSGYHANWRACEPEPWQTEVRTQETTVGLSPLPSLLLRGAPESCLLAGCLLRFLQWFVERNKRVLSFFVFLINSAPWEPGVSAGPEIPLKSVHCWGACDHLIPKFV